VKTWTPVCSDQWPGYNIVKSIFGKHDAVLLGITVDNIPTQFAWTNQMVMGGGKRKISIQEAVKKFELKPGACFATGLSES
jgi:alkyl hydroperoxide reductase subunit AhpC